MEEDLVKKISDGEVVVLRAGEEREEGDEFYAPATISLVRYQESGLNKTFLIDVGGFGEEKKIEKLLKNKKILLRDISSVFITHNHPDHSGNISLFKNSTIFMPDSIFRVDKPNYFKLIPQEAYRTPGKKCLPSDLVKFKILSTPGHSGWDYSVIYPCSNGKIAIVGDLFWSKEDWENDSEYLGLCVNPKLQERSRDYIRIKLRPDIIVPGHGPAFAPKY